MSTVSFMGSTQRFAAGLVVLLAVLLGACGPRAFSLRHEAHSGVDFIYLPPGQFAMGSPEEEPDRGPDETLHEVTLTRGFWLGRTEVTRAQWERVMGPAELHPEKPNPFRHLDADLPMVSVSYLDVQAYLRRLEALSPGERFRLPTEAEWEYACRAGTATAFSTGVRLPHSRAAFQGRDGASPGRPVRVGSYPANPWGLHDMHGNAWEWTSDWYDPYPAGPVTAPGGPAEGTLKVIRGGSWAFRADSARSACRYHHAPRHWGYSLGFRLVWERDPP